jgi:hypothetical protein
MKRKFGLSWSWLLLLLVIASSCGVKKDSPAPGCIEYWGFAGMGGCQGKTVILDLNLEPASDCLQITANNCNGGVLEVDNECASPFIIAGAEIPAGEHNVSLDLTIDPAGDELLVPIHSNFSDTIPDEDRPVSMQGTLGDQVFTLSFTKTAPLCE